MLCVYNHVTKDVDYYKFLCVISQIQWLFARKDHAFVSFSHKCSHTHTSVFYEADIYK